MKALGLVVSEKKIYSCFFLMTPPGLGLNGPRGMAGWIYKEDHYILLHTTYESSGACGFRKEVFYVFPMTPLGRGPYRPQGARLAGFIKRTTIHCYTQNMKALGLVVSVKIFFMFFPLYVYGS